MIEDQGLEQQELAAIVGISTRTLSKRLNAPEDDGGWLFKEITAICKVVEILRSRSGSISSRRSNKRSEEVTRYMIYMPVEGPGRLILAVRVEA